eukprot:XP_011667840.1 PREDICTED: uncharacterized protein LOC100893215 [Strongylocentrotus purpuratus]
MGQYRVRPIFVIFLLTSLAKCSLSLPINDQVPEETSHNLTEYDTARHVGRTLKASVWDSCEFGDTLAPYDESCPNGAEDILPCNPGQLKVQECIGQDRDTSRMCDPCPQKFYQKYYNRCTQCHPCSECGPNEQIKQPCTDETDTDCESIIPPDPVPTTTPTPTTDAPVPSLTTQIIDESTPRVPDATTTASTPQTTRKGPFYTQCPTISTTQNISALEPGTSLNRGTSQTSIGILVFAFIACIVASILFILLWKTCNKLENEQRRNSDLAQRLASQSNSSPVPNVRGSNSGLEFDGSLGDDAGSPAAEGNSGLEPERLLGDDEGPPAAEGSKQNVVVDCPEDERDLWSRGLDSLRSLLPRNVVKDSRTHTKKDAKRKQRVSFHKIISDRSGKKPSIDIESLQPGDRTKFQKHEGTEEGRHLRDEDVLHGSGIPPPGNRRASDDLHLENENIQPSTITTADVHNLKDPQRARESGDGESLQMGDVVRDGHVSRDPNPGDQDDPRNHHGQDNDPSHQSPTDDLHWPAEKVPGSSALPPSRTDGNVSSTNMTPLDNDVHGDAEKVPETLQETDAIGPNVVTDAPLDNTARRDHEDNPRTLRSSAPMADQEEWLEEQEATEANNELDKNTPIAETDEDVLQRLTEPGATVDDKNDGNATPAAEDTPVSDNRVLRFLKLRPSQFFKKQRRKSHDDQPVQQTQPLLRNKDQMVNEKCVEYVADKLKLTKLDKLCRELGLKETEVENYKYELKGQHYNGSELVFKMLVKIREIQGKEFTYDRLDTALRKSHNADVAHEMVRKFLR